MSAQRFTVDEIEAMASGCDTRYCSEFRPLPDLAPSYCDFCGEDETRHHLVAMLRAFALQTRQVEQMREWITAYRSDEPGYHTVELQHVRADMADEFSTRFPKDGGQ